MQLLGHYKDLERLLVSFSTIGEIRTKVQTLDLVGEDERSLSACAAFLPRSQ